LSVTGRLGSILALSVLTSIQQQGTAVTPYGFIEVNDGSDGYLERVLELVRRLSQERAVVLSLEESARPRVEAILQASFPDAERARIELLDRANASAAIPAVRSAGFCVFSDGETLAHLRDDQVAVYSRSWVVES
jgi:hypothetical protein